ncbi:uncharacterized protein LOC127809480 [Diospyros lotus]|uniref:uncharacterized protein LOC127809480 n=1 Tax=Diospyros lotus TaxID=55363 RepID=UPI0022588662|nr:uncharacterized protein LOC127809480 [Diospyros lotus]
MLFAMHHISFLLPADFFFFLAIFFFFCPVFHNIFPSFCPVLPRKIDMLRSQHSFPCFHCHPHSYIRMVQHLIERCLLLRMTRDQCIKALAEHANVRPIVTLTMWRELIKENSGFFQAYFQVTSPRPFMGRQIQKNPRFSRRKPWR